MPISAEFAKAGEAQAGRRGEGQERGMLDRPGADDRVERAQFVVDETGHITRCAGPGRFRKRGRSAAKSRVGSKGDTPEKP